MVEGAETCRHGDVVHLRHGRKERIDSYLKPSVLQQPLEMPLAHVPLIVRRFPGGNIV